MKIEVGMYIRTKKGIAKVTNIDDLDNVAWADKKDIYFGVKKDNISLEWNVYDDGTVLKEPSYNPIDLIEVGDYVNGSSVCLIKEDEHGRKWIYTDSNYKVGILESEIETILTREQYENSCYRIGD